MFCPANIHYVTLNRSIWRRVALTSNATNDGRRIDQKNDQFVRTAETLSRAASSIELAEKESRRVPPVQMTINPSPQSIIGE